MPREKRSGLTISVTDEERGEINQLSEALGGLSYQKMILMLVRERISQMPSSAPNE